MRNSFLLALFAFVLLFLQVFFIFTHKYDVSLLALSSNVLQNLLALCAVVGFWLAYKRIDKKFREEKRGWFYLFLAFVLFFIGDLLWSYWELFLGRLVPIGGFPDVFYFFAYVLLFFGMYRLLSLMFFASQALNYAIIGLTFLIGGLFTYFNIVRGFLFDSLTYSGLIQETYAFFDIIFIGLALILIIPLIVSNNRLFRAWMFFGLGVIALTAFDIAFSEMTKAGMYYTGSPIDIVYSLSFLLFVFCADAKIKHSGEK